MSWDLDRESSHICPCGEGKYIVQYFSDDWHRHDEKWTMICQKCSEGYKLYKNNYYKSGILSLSYGWVKIELLEENTKLNEPFLLRSNLSFERK